MSEDKPVYTSVGSSEKLAEAWQRTYQLSLGEKVIRLRQVLGGMPDGDAMQATWLPLDEMLDMAIGDAQRQSMRIAELEDHYCGAREIIKGERLRREEAERISLSVQQRAAELEAQVKERDTRIETIRMYELGLAEKVIQLRQALGGMPDGDPLTFSMLPLDEMLDMAVEDAGRLTASEPAQLTYIREHVSRRLFECRAAYLYAQEQLKEPGIRQAERSKLLRQCGALTIQIDVYRELAGMLGRGELPD